MRTKILLLTAALSLAGMVSAMAAASSNVYSVNVVGYVTKNVQPGYNMFANTLVQTNTTLAALLPSVPQYTYVYVFNDLGQFLANQYDPDLGGWDPNPNQTLDLGKGFFILNQTATAFPVTFVGEVFQGSFSNNISSGFSYRASPIPQGTNLVTLGLQPVQYDTAARFINPDGVNTSFESYQYDPDLGGWDPPVGGLNNGPTIDVGEGIIYYSGTPGAKLVRSFTVE
jgi:hypothetical protein